MRHAQPCFSILGGQHPVICEHCNICTVTGEGTSFWNIVRHSFTTNFILVVFLREVSIRTQGFLVFFLTLLHQWCCYMYDY